MIVQFTKYFRKTECTEKKFAAASQELINEHSKKQKVFLENKFARRMKRYN